MDGQSFDIRFLPYGTWVKQDRDSKDLLIQDQIVRMGLHDGSPTIEVNKTDGLPFVPEDEKLAMQLALTVCRQQFNLRRDFVFGKSVALMDGVFKFMELCD